MLSQPQNQHVIRKIRAALNAKIRPSALVYGEAVEKPWSTKDKMLVEAYQILEDEKCPECGNPIWICRNEDSNIQFKVRKTTCYGKRRMDEHRTDLKSMSTKEKNKARQDWGKIEWPEPFTLDETPLPTRREFFERLQSENTVD